jgi:hypothetical protein
VREIITFNIIGTCFNFWRRCDPWDRRVTNKIYISNRCTRRKVLVETKAQCPTKTSAMKQVAALGLDINGEASVQLVTPPILIETEIKRILSLATLYKP